MNTFTARPADFGNLLLLPRQARGPKIPTQPISTQRVKPATTTTFCIGPHADGRLSYELAHHVLQLRASHSMCSTVLLVLSKPRAVSFYTMVWPVRFYTFCGTFSCNGQHPREHTNQLLSGSAFALGAGSPELLCRRILLLKCN